MHCGVFAPKTESLQTIGEMAEWPNAVVLKTIEPKGSGGSNPSLSAIRRITRRSIRSWQASGEWKTVYKLISKNAANALSLPKGGLTIYFTPLEP